MSRFTILKAIHDERERQDAKWGVQDHEIRTPTHTIEEDKDLARRFREMCDARAHLGIMTWRDIFLEEVFEVFAEESPARQRSELVQVAAVAVSMIECIDRKAQRKPNIFRALLVSIGGAFYGPESHSKERYKHG